MHVETLESKAKWVRHKVLEMIVGAGKGHLGGSLSATDILVALYHGLLLRYDPYCPDWPNRDRFIMSKGHSSEALYAVLADIGFFGLDILDTYGTPGSMLGGHPDRNIPGVDVSTGSLGHGLGIGAGLALAAKLDNEDYLSVVLLGDGECYEGSIWESAMFAAHHELNNLVAIVDRNRAISLDSTETVNRQEPFKAKWESFGWTALTVDGHSFKDILDSWQMIKKSASGPPIVLIAETKKAKGISFMEGTSAWHHNVPKGDQLEAARAELALDV